MADEVKFKLGAELNGGTQQVFSTMQSNFKKLGKSLQETAKELLKLQKTEAADAVGHVSMAVQKFAKSLGESGAKLKKVTSDMKLLERTNKEIANSSKLAQQAWAAFKKDIESGNQSVAVARARSLEYDKALKNLVADIRVVGGSSKDLGKNIEFSKIKMMQQNKELEISGGRFKKVTSEGYKYLISNEKIRKSIQELHTSSSSYHRVLKELSKITFNGQSYVAAAQAAKQLGLQVGYSEAKFRNLAPLLKTTETNLTRYGTAQKALIGTTASWVKEVDRASIVNQALVNSQTGVTKHIDLTTKGIKILSVEGMKPFGSLSLETANKLGMLDKSFEKFMTSMKVIQSTTKMSKQEVEKLAATFLKSTSSFSAAAQAAKDYISKTKDLNKVSQEAKNLTLRYQELTTASDKYGREARSLLAILEKEPGKLSEIKIALSKLNSERNREVAASKKAEIEYQKLTIQYQRLLSANNKYGNSARSVIETLRQKGTSLTVVRTKMQKLHAEMNNLNTITNRLAKSFRTYASYMVTSTVLRGTVEGFREAARAIIDYDQSLQNLKAITQASTSEVGRMSDAMLTVVKDTKFSIDETGQAMQKLGQAGFDAKEIVQGIPNVANLATGSLESLSTTVDLVSTAVRVFQLGMNQTGKVADIFANAVTKSRLTLSKLNISFNYVGPIAKAAGISLKETAGAMMLLANAGIRASTIGTGLRRMITLLLKPTTAFKEAVGAAGYSMDDFNPRMNSFRDIVAKLPNVVRDSGDAVKMFGVRGSAVITAFTTQGVKELDRLTGALDNQGTAAQMAETQMQGLGVMMKNIKDRFGALAVEIGKAGISDAFTVLVSHFRDFMGVLVEFSGTVTGRFLIRLASVATALLTLSTAIGAAKAAWTAYNVQVKAAIASSLSFLATPIGVALVALAAAWSAVSIAVDAYKMKLEGVVDNHNSVSDAISNSNTFIESYGNAIKAYGRRSKEASTEMSALKEQIDLIANGLEDSGESADAFREETDELVKTMEDFATSFEDSEKAGKKLSDLLANEMVKSSVKAANALTDLYELNQDDPWYVDIVPFKKRLKDMLNIGQATYYGLGQAAKEGNKDAEQAFEAVNKVIDQYGRQLMETNDVTTMGLDEMEALAAQVDKTAGVGVSIKDGLTNYLIDAAEAAWKAKESQQVLGETIRKSFSDSKYAADKIQVINHETLKQKTEALNAGVEAVKLAVEQELETRKAQYQLDREYSQDNADELRRLEKEYQEDVELIRQKGRTAEEALERQMGNIVKERYANQLDTVSRYFESRQELFDIMYAREQEAVQNNLDAKLEKIKASGLSEEEIYKQSLEALKLNQEEQVAVTDAHYKRLDELAKAQYEAKKIEIESTIVDEKKRKEEIVKISEELYKKRKEFLEARRAAYVTVVDALKAKEEELTTKIKNEIKARDDFQKNTDQLLLELKQKTMTEEEILESKRTEANRLASEARQALIAGEFELAKQKSDEAQKAYKDLADSVDKQGKSAHEYAGEITAISREVKDMGEIHKVSSNQIIADNKQSKQSVVDMAEQMKGKITEIDGVLVQTIEKFGQLGMQKVDISVTEALEELQKLNTGVGGIKESLDKLDKEIKFTFTGEASEIKPLSEKLADIKGELQDTFTIDDEYKSITIKIKAEGESGPELLTIFLDAVKQSLSDIQDILKTLSTVEHDINISFSKKKEILEALQEIQDKLKEMTENPHTVTLNFDINGLEDLEHAVDLWMKLISSADKVEKQANITENVTRVVNEVSGGGEGHATGDRIPGYGGGDIIDAKLEPGEWVIRKEAVQKYGDALMSDLNNMRLEKPKYSTGGKVTYKDYSNIAYDLNSFGNRLELLLNPKRKGMSKLGSYKPMNFAIPDVDQIQRMLEIYMNRPKDPRMGDWKIDFQKKVEDKVNEYMELGGTEGYKVKVAEHYSDIQKSGIGRTNIATMKYASILSRTWDNVKSYGESMADTAKNYRNWLMEEGASKYKESMQNFYTGRNGAANSMQEVVGAVPANQRVASSGVESDSGGPSHTVNFQLGGATIGPFSSDGETAESLINTLKIHQLRSA